MFDVLTYEKGAAVVRMLEQYLGEDALPRRHPPATCATTRTATPRRSDLWDALEAATGEPVRRIMDSGSSRAATRSSPSPVSTAAP